MGSYKCYLCGSEEYTLWGEENGYQAVKCSSCGLVYVGNRPSLAEIDESTQIGMHQTEKGNINVIGRYSKNKVNKMRERLLNIYSKEELSSEPISWLDVGAGFGELVEAVSSLAAPKSEIIGIEPCLPKVQSAVARGLNVSPKSLQEIDHKFDYVSMINVFSHLPDPIEFIADLKRILKPSGSLFLITGNAGDISVDEFPGPLYLPDHLSFAGQGHIKRILDMAGFDTVKIDQYKWPWIQPSKIEIPIFLLKTYLKRLLWRKNIVAKPGSRFRYLCVRAMVKS